MIYIDRYRSQLWVTDDTNHRVRCIQIDTSATSTNGNLLTTYAYDFDNYGLAGAHDAMPAGPSGGAPSEVWITYLTPFTPNAPPPQYFGYYIGRLALPIPGSSSDPQMVREYGVINPHSVCVDYSVAPANMWLLCEEFGYARNVNNTSTWKLTSSVWQELQANYPPAAFDTYPTPLTYNPTQGSAIDQHAPAHHLRSVNRTGFVAQYHDGVGLVDLLDVPNAPVSGRHELVTIARFDTTTAVWNTWNYSHIRDSLDRFIGAWDVAPDLDSGIILSNGAFEGGFALQVGKGQLNRYSLPTPLHDAGGIIMPLVYPRVESPYGMPRLGRTLTLKDGSIGRYPTNNGTVGYKWYFLFSSIPPFLTSPPTQVAFTQGGGGAGVLQASAANANPQTGYLNLTQGLFQVFTTLDGALSIQSSLLDDSTEWYCQIVVEQFDLQSAQPTGRWAASKGTWFGVAPLAPAYPM